MSLPQVLRQPAISASIFSRYARPWLTLLSPWYQVTPRMANGMIGAIMPLYIPPDPFSVTVDGSIGEPPQELWIRPIGMPCSLCSFRPKLYSTADKLGTLFGGQTAQLAVTTFPGISLTRF